MEVADASEEHKINVQDANLILSSAYLTLEIRSRPVKIYLFIHPLQGHEYGACRTVLRALDPLQVCVFKRYVDSYTSIVAAISVHIENNNITFARYTARFALRC